MTAVQCPDDQILAELITGQLPDDAAAEHESHLQQCERCLDRMHRLETPDALTTSLRAAETIQQQVVDPAVGGLIERLQQLDVRFGPDSGSIDAIDVRSLLQPPRDADELGRFGGHRILEFLGQGGMGIVFKAEDLDLRRIVALKVMNPVLAASAVACRRFQREARAAAAFEHDHVVTIYHVGEDQGLPFFTMQLLDGESLEQRLAREETLDESDVVRVGLEISAGLAAAHERGLLHRDIKPDNIWLQATTDRVCIVDFGLARLDGDESRLTRMGSVMGTPDYMSPEQARGEEVDPRCDLFSLGSVLYRASTGSRPFARGNAMATLLAVSESPHVPVRQAAPELSDNVVGVIENLLEKQPEGRYASAAEVHSALKQVRHPTTAPMAARPARRSLVLTALAAVAATIAFGLLIHWRTERGTVVVDSSDDEIAVALKDGHLVLRDRDTGREIEISVGTNRVPTGDYELIARDTQSELAFSAQQLAILRGGERRLNVFWKRDGATGGKPGIVVDSRSDVPDANQSDNPGVPAWLAGGQDDALIQPGQPVSPGAMVQTPAPLPDVLTWTVETAEHRSLVMDVALRPDGELLATAGRDGNIRLLDAKGTLQAILVGHATSVLSVAWSPDGRHLATAGRDDDHGNAGQIRIWEIDSKAGTQRLVRTLNRSTGTLSWAPNGRWLAFSGGGVHFWDLTTGKVLPNFGVTGGISRRAWSHDSRLLATYHAEDGVRIWDIERQQLVHTISGSRQGPPAWMADRPWLAWAAAREESRQWNMEILDVDTLRRVKVVPLEPAETSEERLTVRWSPDGGRFVATSGTQLRLYDVAENRSLPEMEMTRKTYYGSGHTGPKVSWSRDGQSVAVCFYSEVWLCRAGELAWTPIACDSQPLVSAPKWLRKRTLLTAPEYRGSDQPRVLSAWDLDTLQRRMSLPLNTAKYQHFWLNRDGTRLLTAQLSGRELADGERITDIGPVDTEVVCYQVSDGSEVARSLIKGNAIVDATWAPGGRHVVLSGWRSNQITVLDLRNGESIYQGTVQAGRLSGSAYSPVPIAWSPDGTHVVWGAREGMLRFTAGMDAPPETLAFPLPEGITSRTDRRLRGRAKSVLGAACSPDGRLVAGCTSGTEYVDVNGQSQMQTRQRVVVWERQQDGFTMIRNQLANTRTSSTLLFSPDSSKLAWKDSESPGRIMVMEIATGEITQRRGGAVTNSGLQAWLDDDRLLFERGSQRNALFGTWNLRTDELIAAPVPTRVSVVTGTSDGAIAVSDHNQIRLLDAPRTLRGTILVAGSHGAPVAIIMAPDGSYVSSDPAVVPLRHVVLYKDGRQETLTCEEFSERFRWKPKPVQTPSL